MEVGCHVLLQGIFPTQGLNPHLHWKVCSLPQVPPGKPYPVINHHEKKYEKEYTCICVHVHTCTHFYVYIVLNTHVHVCMYVYVYICILFHILSPHDGLSQSLHRVSCALWQHLLYSFSIQTFVTVGSKLPVHPSLPYSGNYKSVLCVCESVQYGILSWNSWLYLEHHQEEKDAVLGLRISGTALSFGGDFRRRSRVIPALCVLCVTCAL